LSTIIDSFAQAKAFSFIDQPVALNATQTKMLTKANTSTHVGELKFVRFTLEEGINQSSIKFALPDINNGNVLTFTINSAIYDSPTHYSLSAKGDMGSITLYITPDAIGGTIDLFTKLYVLYPLGDSKGILVEKNLGEKGNTKCVETKEVKNEKVVDFCIGDCGEAILDVLILRTPEANTWLNNTYGWLANWFIFVEGHNMNLALVNSLIPNKRVRVSAADYTPDFAWSSIPLGILSGEKNIEADVTSVSASASANTLTIANRADITVLLTNNGYVSIDPSDTSTYATFGIANSLDPLSTNKFVIAEVPFIDPIRYTMAHELAHQFGCMHSNVQDLVGCPHGKNMLNGRNTIMANRAANNSRIPHYSNPVVSFGGELTGEVGLRDNAQQIRAAFCESANNFPISKFSVSLSVNKVCQGTLATYTAMVTPGDCGNFISSIGINGLVTPNCGTAPYQYKWEKSFSASFINPSTIGTTQTINDYVANCNPFYIRLTVTGSNGAVTTSTNYYYCALFDCFNGSGDEREAGSSFENQATNFKFIAFPNPAKSEVTISSKNADEILGVKCFNTQGINVALQTLPFDLEQKQVTFLTSTLAPGLYIFSVKSKNNTELLKVVIQ
jgi:hypothetical protein